jgi:GntR family transcriptional repressor for pyruvate dehydrogenase complex
MVPETDRVADFKPVRQEKVSLHIIDQIRRAIVEGKLRPGDTLPSEREMTVTFGVSKHTLREALRALEAMGLLDIRKGAGGGPVVVEVDRVALNDSLINFFTFKKVTIGDLTEVRRLLEPHLARHAAQTMTPQDVAELEGLNQACEEILARGESIIGGREEIEFHTRLAETTGNQVLIAILYFVNRFLAQLKLDFKPGLDFSRQILVRHREIVEAIAAGDGDAASEIMLRHVTEVEDELRESSRGDTPTAQAESRTDVRGEGA